MSASHAAASPLSVPGQPSLGQAGIKDASFGRDVKIVKPVNLYGCAIGNDCFIGHGVMFINDTFASGGPAGGRQTLWRATRIGHHVSIGSNATILPVSICDRAVIGAGAVVTKNIQELGIYAGNPARKIGALPIDQSLTITP